tara:strand:- start:4529 stop:4795 length:267 start_codon:yes stop_codon:yes gene_type:complete
MKKLLLVLLVGIFLATTGCTKQSRAKNWGGSYTVDLPVDRELVEATWKSDELWLLTRKRKEGETIDEFTFNEDSSWGVIEGTVTIKEH